LPRQINRQMIDTAGYFAQRNLGLKREWFRRMRD
jgi:hypothetical protein